MKTPKNAIREIAIGKLRPYGKNPRQHSEQQVERVAESIKRFGFNQPIVVDENMEILVGHCRRMAAIQLGLKTVPVLVLTGLSEPDKRAYRIIDNKTADDSTLDLDNLAIELEFLKQDFSAFDLFGLDEFKFPDPPEDDDAQDGDGAPPEVGGEEWAGIISLRVPASDIDSFETQLDKLIRKFPRIIKEKGEDAKPKKERKGKGRRFGPSEF